MKDNTAISSLARPNVKSGKIRFIHFRDGKEHSFYSCVNDLTGSRLSAFDGNAPSVDDSLRWVQSVFDDVRKKSSQVLESIGDF